MSKNSNYYSAGWSIQYMIVNNDILIIKTRLQRFENNSGPNQKTFRKRQAGNFRGNLH